MQVWIDQEKSPPTIGLWALVLSDYSLNNMGESWNRMWKLKRFEVQACVCVGFDPIEEHALWIKSSTGQMPSNFTRDVRYVTHYQPITFDIPAENDWPSHPWLLEENPWMVEDEHVQINLFGRDF